MTWAALQARVNTTALAVFGESVRVAGMDLQADFHEPDETIDTGDGMVVCRVPRVVLQSASVPAAPVGKPVFARGRSFLIADAKHDGRGMAILELEAA